MKLTPHHAARLAGRWWMRRMRRPSRRHGLILMYHRVAAPAVDPWNICVAPDNFAGQMRALADMADIVPLNALPGSLRSARQGRPVAAITFDDAYLDNLTIAKPVLDALDIPATLFVPTGWIGQPRPMWWDRLAHALLAAAALPESIKLHAHGQDFSWREPGLSTPGSKSRKARERLHRVSWMRMRALPDDEARHAALDCLADALGTDEAPVADARAMTGPELQALTADGRISIGSHSVTHPTLPALGREQKTWEIRHSAEQCRELTGKRPSVFAYPYGDLDDESVELVRTSGYALACSTREDLLWEGDDPFLLPRITAGNWSPGKFRKRLNWYWLA